MIDPLGFFSMYSSMAFANKCSFISPFQTPCSISLTELEFQYIFNIKMRADILILFVISEESIQFLTTEYDVSHRFFLVDVHY